MIVDKALTVAQTTVFNRELKILKESIKTILGCGVWSWMVTVVLILLVIVMGLFLSLYRKVIEKGKNLLYSIHKEKEQLNFEELNELKVAETEFKDSVTTYKIYNGIWMGLCVITGIMLVVSIMLVAKYNAINLAINNLEILLKR